MAMSREDACALVQRIMDGEYATEDEADGWLAQLDKALMCPSGYVSGLIFWPKVPGLSAEDVVDQALAYQPIVL